MTTGRPGIKAEPGVCWMGMTMGSVKEYMFELWSHIDIQVSFLCPRCGHPAMAKLQASLDDEEIVEDVSCLNDEAEHDWSVVISKRYDGYSASIEGQPETEISLEVRDNWPEWDEPEPEPDAFGIFLDSMREWHINVDHIGVPGGVSSRNRMLFITLYSIAEAYFSDVIIGSALGDVAVQRGLLSVKELGLGDKQLKLDTILDKPTIVNDMIRASLQSLSYHNLILVSRISNAAFGKQILPSNDEDRAAAIFSISKRHDCVHRNGVDMGGNPHNDITIEYLKKTGGIFVEMAKALDAAVRDARTKSPVKEDDTF